MRGSGGCLTVLVLRLEIEMKTLLCLKTGKIHEVADTTKWGDGFKEVEVFECDGEEWIKHDGGDCPVPDHWVLEAALVNGAEHAWRADIFWWHKGQSYCGDYAPDNAIVTHFRILSTSEEKEDSGHGETTGCGEIVTASFYGAVDDSLKGGCVYTISDLPFSADDRDPSPQEAAHEAKVAAMQEPEPEPKTVPVRCLDDVEFQSLLGMNQFVKSDD